ncbi:Hypothetical protein LUCI_3777 [Lucifera butyrica]|uniref:Bh protein n=2 Tax=Lucifera butyrica TaxID=1351585 RepID=A0A498RAJ9_9FIRM|nr:Hypothetical protein LUCI_3777 [Lucifera butyrica]
MPITRLEVGLSCSKCLKEQIHTLVYDNDVLIRSECQNCGKEVFFYEGSLLAVYAKEVVCRILTKPIRMSREFRRDLGNAIATLPSRIVSKPGRIMEEVRQVVNEEEEKKKIL